MDRFFVDVLADHPWHPEVTVLCYAALCRHCGLANYLISRFGEDVRAGVGFTEHFHGTPLHTAFWNGHLGAVTLLVSHKADMNLPNEHGRTPLCGAYYGRHLEVMWALLDCGAAVDVHYDNYGLLIPSRKHV
jgi:ankyrin repeat protein